MQVRGEKRGGDEGDTELWEGGCRPGHAGEAARGERKMRGRSGEERQSGPCADCHLNTSDAADDEGQVKISVVGVS